MMNDFYLPAIVFLLPLTSCLLVIQVNPYHALIIRGVLGAVAALVDALLGAADVALTEALVGTMLAITLYAVAVRSSLVLRLGVIEDQLAAIEQILPKIRAILDKRHLRLELISYSDRTSLQQALIDKDIHATCIEKSEQFYSSQIRIPRIYEIFHSEISSPHISLVPVDLSHLEEKH
jgi:putative multicomponent Na+:H+ antiporter subunit B